jgi:hypothetical protein
VAAPAEPLRGSLLVFMAVNSVERGNDSRHRSARRRDWAIGPPRSMARPRSIRKEQKCNRGSVRRCQRASNRKKNRVDGSETTPLTRGQAGAKVWDGDTGAGKRRVNSGMRWERPAQHFADLRFLPTAPFSWTFSMYSGAQGTLHDVSPTSTDTLPICWAVCRARTVSGCT